MTSISPQHTHAVPSSEVCGTWPRNKQQRGLQARLEIYPSVNKSQEVAPFSGFFFLMHPWQHIQLSSYQRARWHYCPQCLNIKTSAWLLWASAFITYKGDSHILANHMLVSHHGSLLHSDLLHTADMRYLLITVTSNYVLISLLTCFLQLC